MDNVLEINADEQTAGVLNTIGRNIRQLRQERGLTLQALADQTRLSPSMLSLLERGKTAPSIGTLVVIATALGAPMTELIGQVGSAEENLVSRAKEQVVVETQPGVRRRIVKQDRARNLEIAVNEYEPGTSSAASAHGHEGHEYGIVLEGVLEVTVNGRVEVLRAGDLISYPSTRPHRFANKSAKKVRTLWINLRRT